ncbi:hypothetical protein BCR43DRAFT_509465 [Syncephalastrum racemosum]|uniref:Uncharacterized protein n=1 Tax=Syncephalastrum racemosum TaxID=13706 RepID=A0A1X2HRS0_SYNRA|nr:hypothetical protein BCR43DRAFT_509465 [Syncephalastrum racemosum]
MPDSHCHHRCTITHHRRNTSTPRSHCHHRCTTTAPPPRHVLTVTTAAPPLHHLHATSSLSPPLHRHCAIAATLPRHALTVTAAAPPVHHLHATAPPPYAFTPRPRLSWTPMLAFNYTSFSCLAYLRNTSSPTMPPPPSPPHLAALPIEREVSNSLSSDVMDLDIFALYDYQMLC